MTEATTAQQNAAQNFSDLIVLMLALIASCVFFFLQPLPFAAQGFFYGLWSFFILARLLWVLETVFLLEDSESDQKRPFLPWNILQGMDLSQRLMRGFAALQSLRRPIILWFVFGAFYLLWALYIRLAPHTPYEYQDWMTMAQAAFQKIAPDQTLSGFDAGGHTAIIHAFNVSLCGFAFWLMLACAHAAKNRRFVLMSLGTIFAASVITHIALSGFGQRIVLPPDLWRGYGWGFWDIAQILNYDLPKIITPLDQRVMELGRAGAILAYLPCAFIVFNLARNVMRSDFYASYALGGLFVIACLALADFFLGNTPGIQAVWMSGWALIAAFTAFSEPVYQKRYRLFQV